MVWLIILCVIFLLTAWLTALYTLWSTTRETADTPATTRILEYLQKFVRMIRRYSYSTRRWLSIVWQGIKTSTAYLFFIVFPNAKKAFQKQDELTGLNKGPSSYFLLSVSEYKEEVKKIRPKRGRNKKNV